MSLRSALLLTFVAVAFGCTCNGNDECTNIPSNNVYYLTDFCGSPTACGGSACCGACGQYFAADAQRFGCGAVLSCSGRGHSANLKVIDSGPACWVEDDAKMPIIDASQAACTLFSGATSCGWSDKVTVTCKKISEISDKQDDTGVAWEFVNGPCTWHKKNVTTALPYCDSWVRKSPVPAIDRQ